MLFYLTIILWSIDYYESIHFHASIIQQELRQAYTVAVRSRASGRANRQLYRGGKSICYLGPGEEIHGTATALASINWE